MPQRDVVNDRGWKREFEDPIPLPRGCQLVTLKDAADYIMKLPKAERAGQKIMNENAVVKWDASIEKNAVNAADVAHRVLTHISQCN